MNRCSFVEVSPSVAALVGLRDRSPENVIRTWRLVAAACDPLVVGSADIDYRGKLTIRGNLARGVFEVSFDGLIDAFPAFECYANYNNTTKTLFQVDPPPGNTVVNLLGPPNRRISGWVTFRR